MRTCGGAECSLGALPKQVLPLLNNPCRHQDKVCEAQGQMMVQAHCELTECFYSALWKVAVPMYLAIALDAAAM